MNETIVDMRENLKVLDDASRNAFVGRGFTEGYDPSVFCEVMQNNKTEQRIIYVPCANRIRWFRTDYPEGMVIPDAPTFAGRRVVVTAKVYLTRADFVEGRVAAMNSCTRDIANEDTYIVDATVTRAQSRALRDLGYDLPRDAHEIPGWTPVKVVDDNTTMPEDAMESKASIHVPIIGIPHGEKEVQPPVMVEDEPSVETIETAQVKKVIPDNQPTETEKPKNLQTPEPEVKHRRGRKPKVITLVKEAPSESKPAEQEQPTNVVETKEQPVIKENAAPTELPKNDEVAPASFEDLYKKGIEIFGSADAAANYSSKQLQLKTVGEQSDTRLSYFAKKALSGAAMMDKNLGPACAVVMKSKNLSI